MEIADYARALTSSDWVYLIIFIVAVAEAFALTSYLLSGTIGFVVVGVLIAQGALNPVWSVLAVYLGTLIGDICSFAMARALQRVPFIASALQRVEALHAPLKNAPARFILVGHFTPYLRAMLPLLAGGVVPPRTYLPIEAAGALTGTCFFIGIGYVGAQVIAEVEASNALKAVGLIAAGTLVAMWVYSRKPFCPLQPANPARWLNRRRASWFYLWYLPWQLVRLIELWLRRSPSRTLRRSLAASFPDVRAGDIFVVRLHAPAPWGRWAHSAIAIDQRAFCHGFSSVVTAHTISALPVRYAIAHLRARCGPDIAKAAADAARACLGAPVSIAARRDDATRFSCSSLVAYVYRQVGIELVDQSIARIVPDDLFGSQQVELVRIVHTEKVGRKTRRYVFEARKEG